MSEVINNDQPALFVDEIVDEGGRFPTEGSATTDPGGLGVGFIRTFDSNLPGSGTLGDWQFALGQQLTIASDNELYAALGTSYGGNGTTTFDLPDLDNALIVGDNGYGFGTDQGDQFGVSQDTIGLANLPASLGGSAQPIDNDQPSVDLTYLINTGGPIYSGTGYTLDNAGMVVAYLGINTPAGYLPADGQILSIKEYAPLYAVIGNTYGGNANQGTFALPDLEGRAIVGASADNLGAVTGSDTVTLTSDNAPSPYGSGAAVNNDQPSLALNYLIYVGTGGEGGAFPASGQLGSDTPYLGEIVAYAGNVNEIPAGWMLADGQALSIDAYPDLYFAIARAIDINGMFDLPNLTGLSLAGIEASEFAGGENGGSNTYNIKLAAIPPSLQVSGTGSFTEGVTANLDPNVTVTDLAADATSFSGTSFVIQAVGFDGSFGLSDPNFTLSESSEPGLDNVSAGGVTIGQMIGGLFLSISFTGNATAALVDEVIQHVTLTVATGDPPSSGVVDFTYTGANDNTVSATDTIAIQAVNTPPELSLPDKPYTAILGQPLSLDNPNIYLNDPDGEGGTETLQISVGDGVLQAAAGSINLSIVSGNDTNEVTLSGTTNQLWSFLDGGYSSQLTFLDNDPAAPSSTTVTFFLDDNGNTGSGGPQTATATEIIDIAPCYCAGTRIRTARGHKRVEALKAGDKVRTRSGALRPVKWIGRRSYGGRFVCGNKDVLPVCIRAGALADNVPTRDLWISPHHAMYFEMYFETHFEDVGSGGVLIEAKDLVNGVSIVQAERVETVDYFHVELDTHDVIVAEGALSETFIDDNNRGMFHNAQDYYARYQDQAPAVARYCAPRLEDGYAVEAVRRHIARRAGLLRAADASCRATA